MILATNNIINWQSSLNADLVHWFGNLPRGEMGGGLYWHDLCGRSDAVWQPATQPIWHGGRGRPGGFGCVEFTDSTANERFSAPQHSLVPTGASPRTVSFWFNADTNDASITYCMLSVGGTGSGGRDFSFFYEDNGVSVVWWNHRTIIHKNSLSVGTWYYVTVVIPEGATDTDDPLYYLNGVAATPSTEGGSTQTLNTAAGNILIGGWHPNSSDNFDGKLNDIRIWARALDEKEIQDVYLDSMTGYRRTLNWIGHEAYFAAAGGGATATDWYYRLQEQIAV